MDRHVVIGTAGHIDHGKTALVLALTGVDTDRWAEEKRRGITIDLGFARLDLGDGLDASIVDVPGHEAFVKNMLAGATGLDLAVLVVAADEGVMPQTVEHLAILELLGVTRGVPVITKTDLVDTEWLGLVRDDLAQHLSGGSVAWTEPVAVSAKTGEGLDALRGVLAETAATVRPRSADDLFRLPIDRVFSLPGAGTVVTGTTWSGTVERGASVRILPTDASARIRSIQVHGDAADRATPGRRTALALLDVSRTDITRGDVVITDRTWRPTRRFTCRLSLLMSASRPLRRRERVRVHLGTAAVMGRMLADADLAPGATAEVAVLELEKEVLARAGDSLVLRGASPVTTIGGGVVLDPYSAERWRARDAGELVARQGAAGLDVRELPLRLPWSVGDVTRYLEACPPGVLRVGDRLVSEPAVTELCDEIVKRVAGHHDAVPWEEGLSLQALRAAADAPAEIVDVALTRATEEQRLVVDGAIVRKPDWDVASQPENADLLRGLRRTIDGAGLALTPVTDLEAEFGAARTRTLLAAMARGGAVVAVGREHYIGAEAMAQFETSLREVIGRLGQANPSDLREALGLSRKHLIPLLEWADRSGITRREGDARVLVS